MASETEGLNTIANYRYYHTKNKYLRE